MKPLFLAILLTSLIISADGQESSVSIDRLELNTPITRQLAKDIEHQYDVYLEEGSFAVIEIKQHGIDIGIRTINPSGIEIDFFDSPNGSRGSEMVLLDATETGSYRIVVRPLDEVKRRAKGEYEILMEGISSNASEHLTQVLEALAKRDELPGFSVGIVNQNERLFAFSAGYADLCSGRSYDISTTQSIASIAKTFIGISIMQLVEAGVLDLDQNISELLPFQIKNPQHPELPITLRHLATHTSSIIEDDFYREAHVIIENLDRLQAQFPKYIKRELKSALQNEMISVDTYLKTHLDLTSKDFRQNTFSDSPPGQDWYYCNSAAALAAYIIEISSGMPYDKYVEDNILRPLGMKSTYWSHRPQRDRSEATAYAYNRSPLPRIQMITYADGDLYSSTEDLCSYLIHWIKASMGESTLLKGESYREIMSIQHTQASGRFQDRKDGLFWEHMSDGTMGHNGGSFGITAKMFFDPETNVGFTFLTNVLPLESDQSKAQYESIWKVLKRYGPMLDID